MAYKFLDSFQGYPATDAQFTPATATPGLFPFTPGQYAQVESYDFGGAEFLYARANGAIALFNLCSILPVFDTTQVAYRWNATAVASTANLGTPLAVCMSNTALTAGQYAFFAISGTVPVSTSAALTVGATIGLGTAGNVTGTLVAGKQVLNAVAVQTAAGTIVKVISGGGVSGDTKIPVANTQGLFVGMALSGTNVGAGVISSIDPLGQFVVSTVANTGVPSGNLTATMTGFGMVYINRPFAQGAIT